MEVRENTRPPGATVPVAALAFAAWWTWPDATTFAIAGIVEAALLLALILWAARRADARDGFEERLSRLLDGFKPCAANATVARLVAFDLGGMRYILGGWHRPAPAGIPYHRNNALLPIVALAAFTLLPEAIIVEVFLTSKPPFWHVIDIGAHTYAIFWFIALFASFRDRPHTIEDGNLTIRRGRSTAIRISLDHIVSIASARALTRAEIRGLDRDCAYLALFDSPLILLKLAQPASMRRALGRTRSVTTVYAAVDDARGAIAAIERMRS